MGTATQLLHSRQLWIFPEALENAFWNARLHADRRRAQIVSAAGIIGLLMFGWMDIQSATGEVTLLAVLMRTALGCGMGMALLMASNRSASTEILRGLGLMLIGGTSALLCFENALFWSQGISTSDTGLVMMIITLYSSPAAHVRHMLPVGLAVLALHGMLMLFIPPPGYLSLLYVFYANMLLSAVIFYSERVERRAFLQHRILLDDQRQLTQLAQRYQDLAERDPLTGLFNRRAFHERLSALWEDVAAQEAPIALMIVDIDHFKMYNDTYGHQQGDFALRQLSRTLQMVAPTEPDMVARHGGEEFVIVWPGLNDEGVALKSRELMRRVRMMNIPHKTSPTAPHVTLSAGIAICRPHTGETIDGAFCRADEALYAAKNAGRNRTRWAPAAEARQAG